MKSKKHILRITALLILTLNSSCIESYKISTKVNIDGSIDRVIQVICDDSTSVFNGNLKVPKDSSWTISKRWYFSVPGDTTSDKKFEYTAKRHFKSVNELNEFLNIKEDTSTLIRANCMLEKKFRWFYTYYIYNENYQKSFPFNYFKLNDFVPDYELSYFQDDDYVYVPKSDSLVHVKDLDLDSVPVLSHADSARKDELEYRYLKKISDYMGKNIFEEYYNYLITGFEKTDATDADSLKAHKDSIYKAAGFAGIFLFNDDENNTGPFDQTLKILGVSEEYVKNFDSAAYKILETKIENVSNQFLDDEKIKNNITMPGLLLETNADSINNSTAYWNYSEHYFFLNNYQLMAKSRIVNRWAFYITSVIVIILLLIIVARKKKS